MEQYAVVGNPIEHSLSPDIHSLFAKQTQQNIRYKAHLAKVSQFNQHLFLLRRQGYKGLNITVPFKIDAFEICDELSPRALDAKAVNTLFLRDDDTIAGDNTDGVGLVRDLMKNHRVLLKARKILVLGAGGAVRGVLGPLLVQSPRLLMVANRTLAKARTLVDDFESIGTIKACGYNQLGNEKFDLIINGTSAGLSGEIPPIPASILDINTVCYDMVYNREEDTAFVKWAKEHGASQAYDGLGMLVEQAAEAFYLWRGVMPDSSSVIEHLRNK
ncbi:MAG: shikimate dehydrogenase [Gammaproteobacteria bacterium]|nr:shikimate dehydrogenase [Gammaproteobacteria bacterium]